MPPVLQAAGISRRDFGKLQDGRTVHEYRLDNGNGLVLSAINFGGSVTALHVPDRNGRSGNVMLGLATLADYESHKSHFGAITGRYANRIRNGRFSLEGRQIQLVQNEGQTTLHGGPGGFGRCWWDIEPAESAAGEVGIILRLTSPDGDQGFPGELRVTVKYTLTRHNEWRIDYSATCDRPTVLNLTHHGYFNLAGGGSALDQVLSINAGRYCRIDRELIPQDAAPVDGTPFDFRQPTRIVERIAQDDEQLCIASGYDHTWMLDGAAGMLRPAARLHDPVSGRVMDIETTQPGLQFYSGNFLNGSLPCLGGGAWQRGEGICLETHHPPDSPNRPDFPSTALMPGETFASCTLHRFSIANT